MHLCNNREECRYRSKPHAMRVGSPNLRILAPILIRITSSHAESLLSDNFVLSLIQELHQIVNQKKKLHEQPINRPPLQNNKGLLLIKRD